MDKQQNKNSSPRLQKDILADIQNRRLLRTGDFRQLDSTELIREDRSR